MLNLMQTLLNFSERAARIAKLIRQDPRLFSLLIEEKNGPDKNVHFTHDFKTLADVLIQEALRYYISLKFPRLSKSVRGEESSLFTNSLGEKIEVSICPTQSKTAALLEKVLDGNYEVANILANVVHGEQNDVEVKEDLKTKFPELKIDDLAVWIDPIDSTGEYIFGKKGIVSSKPPIIYKGLPCVTVLIGVYDRVSGVPIAGVISQPFSKEINVKWESSIYWGVSSNGITVNNLPPAPASSEASEESKREVVVVSVSENEQVQEKLRDKFDVVLSSGAGYKGLTVALGWTDAYVCAKASTYLWDTIAPHSLLMSLGGGVIPFKSLMQLGSSEKLLHSDELLRHQILYHVDEGFLNADGVVAYRDAALLPKIYSCFIQPA